MEHAFCEFEDIPVHQPTFFLTFHENPVLITGGVDSILESEGHDQQNFKN